MRHIPAVKNPLHSRSDAYVLIELSTSSRHLQLNELLESFLFQMIETNVVLDGAVAGSDAQRAAYWRLRDEMPQGQHLEGVQIKHDISVSFASLDRFIEDTSLALRDILPGVRINPFGHLGDGNIHFNLTSPEGQRDFSGRQTVLSSEIYRRAEQAGGSFSAEHRLGRTKVAYANMLNTPVERELMTKIRLALDPARVMHSGVIVQTDER